MSVRRQTVVIALAVIAAACNESTGPVGDPLDMRQVVGTSLSNPDRVVQSHAVWSPDGQWVYYISSNQAGDIALSRAATDGSGSTLVDLGGATLDSASVVGPLSFVAPSETGDLYVTALNGSTGQRGVLVLSDGNPPAWLPGIDDPVAIALAPGEDYLVYGTTVSGSVTEADLWSYSLSSGTSTHLTTGRPLAISSAGTGMLVTVEDTTYYGASLTNGSLQRVDLGIGQDAPTAVRWGPTGIHVLFRIFNNSRVGYDYFVKHVNAGTTSLFYQESFADDGSEVLAWSPDGSQIAVWFQVCLVGTGVGSCDSFHSALYVINVSTTLAGWVAGARDAQIGLASYSPDSKRIAYRVLGTLYVSTVP